MLERNIRLALRKGETSQWCVGDNGNEVDVPLGTVSHGEDELSTNKKNASETEKDKYV